MSAGELFGTTFDCSCGRRHEIEPHVVLCAPDAVGRLGEVCRRLAAGRDQFDVMNACVPAGTVSGAPKIRAMEIIEELEPERRGPYAGAVGYFGFNGNMDICITIRTIVMQGDVAYLQAGAGIVADSDPAHEFEETGNKLQALSQALLIAEGRK